MTWSRRRGILVAVCGCLLLVGVIVAFQLGRPLPDPVVRLSLPATVQVPGAAPTPPWPAGGQAAISVPAIGWRSSSPNAKAAPIASVAKVMTAYVILRDHPLHGAEEGPALTMRPVDVERYATGARAGQSELAVRVGERLSERQALAAVLVPSANNIAAALAEWDAGSTPAFVAKMNATAASLGMKTTTYTDPSGFDARTVSTPMDQVVLAEAAMQDPVFAALVAMPSATFPIAGTVKNYNSLIGQDGFVGVKTGSTFLSGGCLVFALRRDVEGRGVMVFGAVMGQQGRDIIAAGVAAARSLGIATAALLQPATVVEAGTGAGEVRAPWGASAPLVVGDGVRTVTTAGATFTLAPQHRPVRPRPAKGAVVATVGVDGPGTHTAVSVRTNGVVRAPSVWWRLTRF